MVACTVSQPGLTPCKLGAFNNESITSLVLKIDTNSHFSAITCGVHISGSRTWLDGANTVSHTPATLTRRASMAGPTVSGK